MNKIIKDDTSNMGMFELAHNLAFVRDGEAWYRDFSREISVRNLMREICSKHGSPADADGMDDDALDEMLFDNLQYGTDELEGVFSLLYTALWGMAMSENGSNFTRSQGCRPQTARRYYRSA